MIDDQIAVGPQFRIGQCVGDTADRLVGRPAGSGGVLVEHDVETDLRQFRQLGRDRRPLLRLGIGPRLDPFGSLLAQGNQVDIRLRSSFRSISPLDAAVCARPAAIGKANRSHGRPPARERCRPASFAQASAIPRSADRLVAASGSPSW